MTILPLIPANIQAIARATNYKISVTDIEEMLFEEERRSAGSYKSESSGCSLMKTNCKV